jgi:hypothetical protein
MEKMDMYETILFSQKDEEELIVIGHGETSVEGHDFAVGRGCLMKTGEARTIYNNPMSCLVYGQSEHI